MKKKLAISIPFLAVTLIAASVLMINRYQAPAWKARLDQYLTYLRQTGQNTYRVISTGSASSPASFTPAMSAESYGDNFIFQTSRSLFAESSTGLQPMPYPPDQVICVLLDGNGQRQLVYVALHNDLYNADWIVHISPEPWGSSALQVQLDTLGCSLDT